MIRRKPDRQLQRRLDSPGSGTPEGGGRALSKGHRPRSPLRHGPWELAGLLQQQGKPDAAIAHYQTALEIEPNSLEFHNGLGGLLVQQRRFDDAIAHFEQAAAIAPNNLAALINLGNVFVQLSRPQRAIGYYRKALAIDPHCAEAHYFLAGVLQLRDGLPRRSRTGARPWNRGRKTPRRATIWAWPSTKTARPKRRWNNFARRSECGPGEVADGEGNRVIGGRRKRERGRLARRRRRLVSPSPFSFLSPPILCPPCRYLAACGPLRTSPGKASKSRLSNIPAFQRSQAIAPITALSVHSRRGRTCNCAPR